MRGFGDKIYAMNESLLDDVEADEVVDDEEAGQPVVYRFMFHFKCDLPAAIVKKVFFDTAMEPALGRLNTMGLVESWNFIKKYGKAEDFPNLQAYIDIVENARDLKQAYGKGAVLSVDVTIPDSAENADDIVTISAYMFQYALGCKLDSDGGLRMSFWKQDSRIAYSVFFDKGKRWAFHCGTKNGRNYDSACKKFAGLFVRTARNMGIMEAVDDARSRFIAYGFGSDGDYNICMFDSGGNCLFSHKVEPYRAGEVSSGIVKFNEYGLLLVRFSMYEKNFLRMDGSKLMSDDFDSDFDEFWEGYFQISRKDNSNVTRYNLIDKDGNTLFDDWCTYVGNFVDGIALIWKDDSSRMRSVRNFIDKSGKPVLSEWYDYVNFEPVGTLDKIHEPGTKRSVARIGKYDRDRKVLYYNYADRTGKILLKDWIRGDCGVMENGFAKLCRFEQDGNATSNKYNYMREDGSIVSEKWFDELAGWPECGVFAARTGKEWVFMDTDTCEVLFGGTVFNKVEMERGSYGFNHYEVRTEPDASASYGYGNLISPDGTMCCDKTEYAVVNYVGNGFADVREKMFSKDVLWKWGEGPVDLGRELTTIVGFRGNYATVSSGKQWNLIGMDGNLVSDTWFEYITDVEGGFAGVVIGEAGKSEVWDLLACKTGVLIFGGGGTTPVNKHYVISPDEVVAVRSIMDNRFVYNMFDANGNKLLGEWTDFPIEPAGDGIVRIGPNSYADYSGNNVGFL